MLFIVTKQINLSNKINKLIYSHGKLIPWSSFKIPNFSRFHCL